MGELKHFTKISKPIPEWAYNKYIELFEVWFFDENDNRIGIVNLTENVMQLTFFNECIYICMDSLYFDYNTHEYQKLCYEHIKDIKRLKINYLQHDGEIWRVDDIIDVKIIPEKSCLTYDNRSHQFSFLISEYNIKTTYKQ